MDETSMLLGWLAGRRIAAQRKKQTEVWETVIDDDLSFKESTGGSGWAVVNDYYSQKHGFASGDTIRLTVNGVANTFTAQENNLGPWIGNPYVIAFSSLEADTGYDFYVSDLSEIRGYFDIELYSRIPGTYSVRLERLAA